MMNNDPNQRGDEDRLILAIKEEEIRVAPESKVDIHVAVINQSPNEDYVDILVKGVPADWITIDTPVVHLSPGETKQVTLTVQPPPVPQSRVGQYPLDVRAVSQNNPTRSATARSTLTVAAYESRGRIGILLGSMHFLASPGSTIQIPILLQNRGVAEDSFRLSVVGIPVNWISTNSALTKLSPSTSKEVMLTIRVPHSPEAVAGRTPFRIQFTSQNFPDQRAEVECILTVSAFTQFSASLQPETFEGGQSGRLIINNEGNIVDTFNLSFQSPGNVLLFEKGVPVSRPESPGEQQIEAVEIPPVETFQIAPGESVTYYFRARLRSRPIVGGEKTYPFTVQVSSSENKSMELLGEITERGYIPVWLLSTLLIGFFILCFLILIPVRGMQNAARATQTAIFVQTQAALSGQEDSDGDGLINSQEIDLGTDPVRADTDEDQLSDGAETTTHMTNPLVPDTDADELLDGEEIQTTLTDPLNPDMDGDGLLDGEEIERRTDPRNRDTDGDGLPDGDEIRLETDPLNRDSDGDGLSDGQENQNCPRPRDPDSDDDGITDGRDRDACNPSNPSLTATAISGAPTQAPAATATLAPTQIPTSPSVATLTPAPPALQGVMLFASNRDGNSEIYSLNLANQSIARLTNNPAQDMQAALAPDSVQVAYVTNQDGNNEIYLSGLDGRVPLNLTNNPADDQQPTWSPDGNWIAFTTNRDGNQEIYVMRRDGSQIRNLTNNPANDFAPTWFSTGGVFGSQDWIAFTTTRDGNQEVYKVRPDGSGLTNLTQNPANDYSPSGFFGGSLLAFVTDRNGNPEIYRMTDSGGSPTNLTNNFAQDLDPALNSNGSWVAFSTDRDGNLEVYVVSINGGAAHNLTRNASQDREPDW